MQAESQAEQAITKHFLKWISESRYRVIELLLGNAGEGRTLTVYSQYENIQHPSGTYLRLLSGKELHR